MTVDAHRGAADKEARPSRDRLLTSAEQLFGERTYRDTTVAGICSRAGIATGSFYSHFESKQEIFSAVVDRINADVRAAMRRAMEAHGTSTQRDVERAGFRAYCDVISQRPWIHRIIREAEFVVPGQFREYYETLTRRFARGVRRAQMAGDIDPGFDPEVIAYLYTGMGNFVGMRWAEWTGGGRVPDDVLDDVFALLAHGLPPRGAA
ncbi:AcrR family transcriptional regulator [Spinactinospora alkalitolerans]|uniref:AcrR family transcriptional regulator n=1 Tax=Spinactinospora alkalitolerans TaxID=687207 RepID=A0A852U1P3_9ACTN|nr:TetR/AcrR family transcriptional regulator [Spinactinospora alkalitolerans]NYE48084.1 AcrR family transcriptional regulator [Spinactinospora alkalitolerans]